MTAILHWFRRDLRIEDNRALHAAGRDADAVVPVFILDDHYLRDQSVGPSRFVHLRESLEDLDRNLRSLSSALLVVPGPAEKVFPELVRRTGASAVYANAEIGPYPEARDERARKAIELVGARLRLFQDGLAVDPETLRSGEGKPYTVFAPFSKKWKSSEKRAPVPRPAALRPVDFPSVPVARVKAWRGLAANPLAARGGETEARKRFFEFLRFPVGVYGDWRDYPAQDATSRLSAALHFGTISSRTMVHAAAERVRSSSPEEKANIETFVTELCWREFFHSVLLNFPHVASGAFRREFDLLEWNDPGLEYFSWTEGRTGYPFIDAAMRQLTTENWMHNRARMAVASFLVKDLHLSWQIGEKWFEHSLVDADLANNNGGWQWAAGTGTDAAPYFRIFNPVLQSKKFDPSGDYIRKFIPELAHLSNEEIHLPRDPIVDHEREKAETLRRYEKVVKRAKKGN